MRYHDSMGTMTNSDRPLVIGIAGSIRNRAGLEAVEGVDRSVRSDQLVEGIMGLEHRGIYHEDFLGKIQPHVKELTASDDSVITNSETLLLTALYGAKKRADVEYHKLTDHVGLDKSFAGSNIDKNRLKPLVEPLQRADGIIIGSPVYFGDRSSLTHAFLNFAAERHLLEDKVVSVVSCGSKRNGGQETTNVYSLFESLDHGAIIVGNGPKTCQYGGTGWGGDIGDTADDEFGLETSLGTGLRVSKVAEMLNIRRQLNSRDVDISDDDFQVGVLILRESNGKVKRAVRDRIDSFDGNGVEFNVIDFTDKYIQACIGCDVCPTPSKVKEVSGEEKGYKCIIDDDLREERWSDDDLQRLHSHIVDNDALIIAVYDGGDSDVDDVYQNLLERTRYIRRDDWLLHNVPLTSYVVREPDESTVYPLKIMTSWMRHNTLIFPPIVHTKFEREELDEDLGRHLDNLYNDGTHDQFQQFVRGAREMRSASELTGRDKLSYKATGYDNKILDKTVSERT